MIPKGYKHTELGILPEDWEVVRLGEIGKIVGGGTPDTENLGYWTQQNGIAWLTPTEIKTKYITESQRQITKKGLEESSAKQLPKHTILITTRATIGDIGIAKVDCATNQGFQSLICSDSLSYEYAYYALQAFQIKKHFIRSACGSTFLELSSREVRRTKIPLPPLAEQEKIAEILSAWDTQIQNFETLITEKQALKKGLCQTLLTAKTRLKGFSGDWEVVRLGELGKIVGGGTPNTESSKYWTQQGGIVWLTPTEIKTKYITESRRQITEKGLEESSAKKLPKNTLLITTRATIGDIGIAKVECTTNQGFQSLVCSDSLNYEYAYYALQAYQTKKYFTRFACGSTFLELSSKEVKKTKIPLPPLAEQEKIAEILSEADNEITLLEQKLESLKSQKKGIIQILLNGKVRIKI